ncbi:DUF3270 family protein [Lactococcus insecticola]|uniref:DUF3270 domain-containing protein n=1 Tax=Pseudolactococcus insecticola TaxID=2709158 RepID=A0A6A0B585_9LACT|nr:DUF3270 family protein [Lactococcus insecticola]GFH40569.1 hypothetical protein Hs20B_09670 [Lactococcus insecticola]
MEAPKYDEDIENWQSPTRDYLAEEKVADETLTAERYTELTFFANIAIFSIFMVISCYIFAAILPNFLAVLLAIASSYYLLQVSKQAIKILLSHIKK